MNLAQPSIGDIMDRLSILWTKGETSSAEYLSLKNQLEEMLADGYMGGNACPWLVNLVVAALALGGTNGRLWELHDHKELDSTPLGHAKALNQQRRQLIKDIG